MEKENYVSWPQCDNVGQIYTLKLSKFKGFFFYYCGSLKNRRDHCVLALLLKLTKHYTKTTPPQP